MGFEGAKMSIGDTNVAPKLTEVGAYDGEMVVFAHMSDGANGIEGLMRIERAPKRIARIRGIGDELTATQPVNNLVDEALLRVVGVNVDHASHERSLCPVREPCFGKAKR